MSQKTAAQLFAEKASKRTDQLGKSQGKVAFDSDANRFYQRFEHGIIYGKSNESTVLNQTDDLVCVYGRIWERVAKPEAAWLGLPLEDPHKEKGFRGDALEVQLFEHGVVWYRENLPDDIHNLPLDDLRAIVPGGMHFPSPPLPPKATGAAGVEKPKGRWTAVKIGFVVIAIIAFVVFVL